MDTCPRLNHSRVTILRRYDICKTMSFFSCFGGWARDNKITYRITATTLNDRENSMFKKPRNVLAFALLTVLVSGCTLEEKKYESPLPRSLNPAETKFISTDFELKYRTEELPKKIVNSLGFIANPGEAFNPTDVVDPNLPSRRIIFAGISENMVFVYFEQGGFAPHCRLLLYELINRNIEPTGVYIFPHYVNGLPVNDLPTLKSLIKEKACEYYRGKQELI
jgi:hypothetical protein